MRQLDARARELEHGGRTLHDALRWRLGNAALQSRYEFLARLFPLRLHSYAGGLRPGPSEADEEDTPIVVELTPTAASRYLRLASAMTYYGAQGLTLRDQHVCLMDTDTKNFTMRHLIVGMSRATEGRFVHIASADDLTWLCPGQSPPAVVDPRPFPTVSLCCICFELLGETNIRTLGCRHRMHVECLADHLVHRRACPLCLVPIPDDDRGDDDDL